MAFTSILNFPFLFPLLLIPFPQSAITQEASTSTRESPHESMMRLAPAQVLEGVPQLDDQEYKSPLPMAMQAGTVWPLPQKLHYGSQNRTLRSGSVQLLFRGGQRDVDCDILEHAKNTYLKKWLFPSAVDQQVPQPNSVGTGVQLVVKLRKRCPGTGQFPTAEMNEEYRLTVPLAGEAVLEADEIWGILRGLETFSQLIFQQRGQLFIRTATIHDWPEYPVRGILLDSSRHFLHKNLLLRQIDLLAQNKMNVLHWHIVDMESFPYMSSRFPNMSTEGAFSPKHTYSPETVREVVQHARLRGVRVVPEFDTPGHMASWKGSGILAECRDNKGKLVPSSMLDPSRESTFAFLKEFLKEVVDTFPDQYLHLGGDETAYWTQQCWAYNPQIRAFMAQKGFANITQLENFYFSKLQAIVKEVFGEDRGRRMIFWQEVFDHNRPDRTAIVHNWYSHNAAERSRDIKRAVQRGFQVLVSSCWYLNLINYGADWRQKGPAGGEFYQCDPRGFEGTYAEKQLVIGGVATMWGEFVDGTNVEATLWPRASAVAERLWSPPEFTKSAEAAWPRLQEHRCRMIARGYRAEPVNGSDFCLSAWADQPVE